MLKAHNRYRAKHGSPPLKWSAEAAAKAQAWAQHLAVAGNLEHGDHEGMGQNLAYKSGAEFSAQDVADNWYNEERNYDYRQPGFRGNTGHFTQMVWKNTGQMGVGRVVQGKMTYVVANYIPPGNITSTEKFEQNVQRPSLS